MPIKLPACFIRDEVADTKAEAEPYRDMTPDERGRVVDALCRDALIMLRGRRDRRRMLDWRDPMPSSTKAALARLRASRT